MRAELYLDGLLGAYEGLKPDLGVRHHAGEMGLLGAYEGLKHGKHQRSKVEMTVY